MFASATLKYIQHMARTLWPMEDIVAPAQKLQLEIDAGIKVCERKRVLCYFDSVDEEE
jgi:hypothetical protein